MKLSKIVQDEKLDSLLENVAKQRDESDVVRPYGISKDEFTPEYIEHLKGIRHRNPVLYNKIISGD